MSSIPPTGVYAQIAYGNSSISGKTTEWECLKRVSTPAASQGEWQAEQEEGAKQAEQPAASQEEAQQEEALAPLSAAAEAEAER